MDIVKVKNLGHVRFFVMGDASGRRDEVHTKLEDGRIIGTHVYVIHYEHDYMIWHVPQHKYTSGTNQQGVRPSMYYLVHITDRKYAPVLYGDVLYGIESGCQWNRARKVLIDLIQVLRKGYGTEKVREIIIQKGTFQEDDA